MTVQDLLERAIRRMIPENEIHHAIRKGDGTAYYYPLPQSGLCVCGFVDQDLCASIEDGFITIRRRSYVGVAGSTFDFRDALLQNHKHPSDVIGLHKIDGNAFVIATSTRSLPLCIEPERLTMIVHLVLDWSLPPFIQGIQEMSGELRDRIWEKRGFDLLCPK